MAKSLLPSTLLLWSAAVLLAADKLPVTGSAPEKPPAARTADSAKTGPPAGEKPAIKHLGGPRYELNGISFNEDTRSISFPAKVNMTEGLLEYALVHESGKAHESFLTTTISPYDLNIVLLLLSYTPSKTFFDFSDEKAGAIVVKNPKIEPKACLQVTLDWKDPAGKAATARLETLVLNIDQKAPAKDGPFTYTGSMLTSDGTFMAKDTGSILALYADPAALINNPREGNENDDAWITDKAKTPAKGTGLTLTLTPKK